MEEDFAKVDENSIDNNSKNELRRKIIASMISAAEGKDSLYTDVALDYYSIAPATFYKYFSDTSLNLETVKSNKLWYSAPRNFNDVFDCDIPIDSKKIFDSALHMSPRPIRQASRQWIDLKARIQKRSNALSKELAKLKDIMGVSCFSESCNSLLMWAHYANNHKGMCVEYNLMDINEKLGFTAVPIVYSKERVNFNSLEKANDNEYVLEIFFSALTSKSPEWAYEKEWRIIRENVACGDAWEDDKKGALLDMIKPTSITLGCAVQRDFENEVKDFCKYGRINLYKMEKDNVQYRLNKNSILEFDV